MTPYPQIPVVEDAARRIARVSPGMNASQLALCRVAVILGRDLTARLDDMLAPVDLTELEYRLLVTLYSRKGAASPGELGAALAQSPANVTRMGDLMVERGLVTRRPDETDRRRRVLDLTAAGSRLVRSLLPMLGDRVSRCFARFSKPEQKRFMDYLKRLVAALDGLPATNSPKRRARRKAARQ